MSEEKINVSRRETFLKWFWGIFAGGTGLVILIFFLISVGWLGYMPPLEELENPQNRNASEIFSADNKTIGRYYKTANRISVEYKDISPYLVDALVATEDARFYDHMGVDPKALMRAVLKMGKAGGGSTLTQQLAKQIWSQGGARGMQRVVQKPIEWVIAIKLERLYSKEQIITMYLNQFDFLYNAVGIETASRVYFNKKPIDLSIEEAATLVGMCKNPSLYNPLRYPTRSRERRNVVFSQMCKYGYISQAECDSLQRLPLECDYHVIDHTNGIAPYFREYIRRCMMAEEPLERDYPEWNKQQYRVDKYLWENDPLYGFCNKNTKQNGEHYNIYTDGLRIYTTLDTRMQRYAEEAVEEHMRYLQGLFFQSKKGNKNGPFTNKITEDDMRRILERSMRQTDRYRTLKAEGKSEEEIKQIFNTPCKMQVFTYNDRHKKDTTLSPMDSIIWTKYFLRCGFMAMDPHSGHVKAYVGGNDFDYFKYDMATLGRRQVGSTVKPYLFAYGMSEGMWPCEKVTVHRQDVTFKNPGGGYWTPRDGHGGGPMTLAHALAISSNWMSAWFMAQYGPDPIVKLMKSFGLKGDIDPNVTICMGSCEVSVEEMVNAYTTFINGGIRIDPMYVTRIEDNTGNVIATFAQQSHEVLDELSAKKMVYMMREVCRSGTGRRINGITSVQMAGKTGTTNNNSDGWFVGYSPSLVSGAWVGGEDRSIHFDYTGIGQGASMALPIVGKFTQKCYSDPDLGYDPKEQFDLDEDFMSNMKNACMEYLQFENTEVVLEGDED